MEAQLSKRTFTIVNSGQLTLIIVPLLLLVLASVAVVLRFKARKLKKTSAFTDDYLILLALIFAYGGYAANLVMVLAGGGAMPMESLTHTDLTIWFKGIVANYVLWVSAVAATQLSILWFYTRIFGVVHVYYIACLVAMAVVGAWWISAFVSEVTACIPLSKAWTPTEPGTCIDDSAMCAAVGIIHVVFDFTVLALPLPLVWRLQKMSTMARTGVSLLFVVGIFASICSILRIDCLVKLGKNPDDKTGAWMAMLFQVIEAPVGIFCICVPNLPPVWEEFTRTRMGSIAKRLFSTQTSSQNSRSNPTIKTWDGNHSQTAIASNGGIKKKSSSIGGSSRALTDRTDEEYWRGPSSEMPLQDVSQV